MANVILENISKNFGKKEILNDINLEIKEGEFVVLVGASGCGKSTLLRMIAGLEHQNAGDIIIGNKIVNDITPKDRNIAMVFQNYALYPHLNVRENIALGLKVRHVAKCEIERRILRAVEILKLEDYLNARPKELSGGQRQRVALARAIVREPLVFLMDEPLSNLDAKLRIQMRAEIKKLHKKLKTTFIYVTHDQTEALTMGDKIVVLNEGKIQQADTPYNIYHHPKNVFVATFMGTHPMNIAPAEIKEGFIRFGNIALSEDIMPYKFNASRVLIGVRSENILPQDSPIFHFNTIKFSAKITFEENLGSHKNLYFKFDDNTEFCAVVPGDSKYGESVEFSINPRDLHFFDYDTKMSLEKF